ncbi:protein kinase domain-containing protein [Rubritalea sp.]|uniref:protein kinase domain-containing protein n=1 Tax=Rubritalea sp. TaxID=2109375 RepID=UPI003EF8644A
MITTLPTEHALTVSVGQCSLKGVKKQNEDCIGIHVPDAASVFTKGIAVVIADGVSAASGGKLAAEMCVQSFLSDYYSTPDTWSVKTSGHRILTALNRWLYSQGHSEGLANEKGYLSTHSSIIFTSNTAHIFHIGDTRIYRIRNGEIEQLTNDHSTQISKNTTYLSRAMGLNLNPKVDFKEFGIELNDLFLLSTDGVHEWLRDSQMLDIIKSHESLDVTAKEIVNAALLSGSNDNLSCQLVQISAVPGANQEELQRFLRERPFPPLLYPGMSVDGLEVESVIFESARSQLYRVRDTSTKEAFVMKTPSPNFQDDPAYIDRFVAEEWIGRRVDHKNLIKVVERPQKATFLYYLMEEVKGKTLAQWMDAHKGDIDTLKIVRIVEQIVSGVRALHRKETIHQDLKLDNIMLTADDRPVVIDYGSCKIESIHGKGQGIEQPTALGTIDFSAPEYRLEIESSIGVKSDQFSIAMIAYHLLTGGKCPYGDKWTKAQTYKDFSLLEYIPAYKYKPMVPVWVDGALKRALSVHAESRYSSMSELVRDLKDPNPLYVESRHLPLMERNPERFWKITSSALFVLLVLVLLYK